MTDEGQKSRMSRQDFIGHWILVIGQFAFVLFVLIDDIDASFILLLSNLESYVGMYLLAIFTL